MQKATELLMDLAGKFAQGADEANPDWDHAYLRVASEPGYLGVSASYAVEGKGDVFLPASQFGVTPAAGKLRDELAAQGKSFRVLLLTIDDQGGYEVDFEHANAERWRLSIDPDKGLDAIPRD
jgi:hypothetical protein